MCKRIPPRVDCNFVSGVVKIKDFEFRLTQRERGEKNEEERFVKEKKLRQRIYCWF